MRKTFHRMLCALLAAVLTAGLSTTAFADGFKYPNDYWPLQDEWVAADAAGDPDRVIAAAQKIYDLLSPYGLNSDVCNNLQPKCAKASWCSEMKGDLQGAITWLERQRTYAQWLAENEGGYKDLLATSEWRLRYLKTAMSPKIYALSTGVNSPYANGPSTGIWYGSVHEGSQSGESGVLAYINFLDGQSSSDVDYWINNYKAYSPKFAAAVENGSVIELAWNFENGPEQVISASDSQISSAVAAIASLNTTVLLRLGAEMNNVQSNPDAFKQAFQRIAGEAHKYPNIKTVFSPNDVGLTLYTKFEDYYPGDGAVDWIGVSTYHNSHYTSRQGSTGAYDYRYERYNDDAFYGEGVYDSDPLVILQPLTEFAQAHNKPMMISECGFGYKTASDGEQNAYAVDQVTKFYSYVSMIYPQIRAVFYFDYNPVGEEYIYALSGNPTIDSAYKAAIAGNGAYLAGGQTSGSNWRELSQVGSASGKVRLGTYAIFPGKTPTTVQYYVDGNPTFSSSTAPYYYDLDTSTLSAGKHTIQAEATSGAFKGKTVSYELTVAAGASQPSQPAAPQTGFQLESAAEWARPQMQQAHDNGLLTARTENGFQNQITRLQFADLAVNLAEKILGQPITPVPSGTFTDTDDEAVRKANAAKIASGKGDGLFAPDDKITRQEICVMLSNVIRYVDSARGTSTLSNPSLDIDTRFEDRMEIAAWAMDPGADDQQRVLDRPGCQPHRPQGQYHSPGGRRADPAAERPVLTAHGQNNTPAPLIHAEERGYACQRSSASCTGTS